MMESMIYQDAKIRTLNVTVTLLNFCNTIHHQNQILNP